MGRSPPARSAARQRGAPQVRRRSGRVEHAFGRRRSRWRTSGSATKVGAEVSGARRSSGQRQLPGGAQAQRERGAVVVSARRVVRV